MSVVGEIKRVCLSPDSPQVLDQCASNSDCEAKGTTRTVCKEYEGQRKCVAPDQCLSKCENTEVCTQEHKCKASWECKKDKHCAKNEFCRKFVPGGKSFCSPLPPGVVKERPLPDQCGSGLDCQDKGDATICKEVDGKQICVRPEQCLDLCEDEEVCGAGNQCKPMKACQADNDCKTNEVCKRFTETGPKTCLLSSGVRPPKFDECAMNKDCSVKGKDLICKEDTSGIRNCVN